MAKKEKSSIKPIPREAIQKITGEEDFIEFLRHELEWPIPLSIDRLDDVAIPYDLQQDFGFSPEEDRIRVSRLLNLTEEQPWAIFLFEFQTRRPYVSHLRRLLRGLGSRRTLQKGDPIWSRSDILFICVHDWIDFQFVHFSGEKTESAIISSFEWHGPNDNFLHTLCKHNLPKLRFPAVDQIGDSDGEKWRTQWSEAFNIKPVTDEFYSTLKEVFNAVQAGVKGLKVENRRFFAELLVNRLIFLKFVEKKGWLNNDENYLYNSFKSYGRQNYWQNFLCDLFFEGLCKEKVQRTKKVNNLLGDIPFLNAELFAPSDEWDDWEINVENRVFDLLFDKLLNPYNFTVCETSPLDVEVAFNQDLLGYGYEELIADQHGQGAYYTHPTEVNLMCRESLRAYLEGKCPQISKELIGKLVYAELTDTDPVSDRDALALYLALHDVTVVDPALGSGTFPVAIMKHIFLALRTIGRYLKSSTEFEAMLKQDGVTDPNDAFALKLHIIERSIYGCDIDYFAVQIAKLRFWIELMVDCDKPEALPNFNCKLVVGDALVGVVGTDTKGNPIMLENLLGHPTKGQMSLAKHIVDQLAALKSKYFTVRDATKRAKLEQQIAKTREDLLHQLGIQTDKVKLTDKHVLWQIDFAEIFASNEPGFDIAIANPPYLRQELIDSAMKDFGLRIDKKLLQSVYNKLSSISVSGKADLYVYFYLRSIAIVEQSRGTVCFICSNSWMDVDFGSSLKDVLSRCSSQVTIIDNKSYRSFDIAAINTVITILKICDRRNEQNAKAIFVMFNVPFERCTSANYLGNVFAAPPILDYRTEVGRANVLAFTELVGFQGSVCCWGGQYLRAPDLYLKLLQNYRNALSCLGEISTLRFGIKTGANEFFHVDTATSKHWNIEKKYLMPIVRSPRECKGFLIDMSALDYQLLTCNESKTALRGSNVLRYIEWGEKQGYNKRPSCRNRPLWYSIGEQMPADFIMLRFRDQRNWTPIIASQSYAIGDTVFVGAFHKHDYRDVGSAMLNSTLAIMMSEIFGRANLGDGLLTTYGPELHEMLIVKPEILLPLKDELMRAFRELSKRDVLSVFDEIKQPDRQRLDKIILRSIGMTEDYLTELYEGVIGLLSDRLRKARSAGLDQSSGGDL